MSITSLEEKYFENIDYLSFEYNFLLASKNGNLCLIRWLYYYDYNFVLSKYALSSFCLACENNQLDVVKFIFEKEKNIDLTDHIENIFSMAFEEGYIGLIMWLYDKFSYTFNSLDMNLLFLMSCENNYIDLIRWIFSINPNIRINMNKDNIFIKSCRENNLELAKLFVELRPNGYYVNIIDNEICHFEVISSLVVEKKIEKNKVKKIENCLICYENNSTILTKCNHFYCFNCIENHFYINDNRCPYCRTENDELDLTLVINSV